MSMLSTAIIQSLENSDTPTEMIGGLRKLLTEIEDAMVHSRREISHVSGDADFSKTGRQKRVIEILQATANTLDKIEHSALGYSDHIRQLQDGMAPDQRPTDSTLSFLQEQEVRQRLDDMDILLLQVEYMSACTEGGDNADLLAAACENDPLPRLSPEVLQQGIQARGMRKSPKQAKLLADLIKIRSALRDSLGEARAELRKNGLPKDDWVAQVAKGEIVPD